MYPNFNNYSPNFRPNRPNRPNRPPYDDDRLIGGFAFPFLLGGVTGAALAPNFWRPNYGPRPMPFYPYPPFYGPYYR